MALETQEGLLQFVALSGDPPLAHRKPLGSKVIELPSRPSVAGNKVPYSPIELTETLCPSQTGRQQRTDRLPITKWNRFQRPHPPAATLPQAVRTQAMQLPSRDSIGGRDLHRATVGTVAKPPPGPDPAATLGGLCGSNGTEASAGEWWATDCGLNERMHTVAL